MKTKTRAPAGEACAQPEHRIAKTKTRLRLCTTTAQQRQDQHQQKPMHNHRTSKSRAKPGDTYAQPKPSKDKTKTQGILCTTPTHQRQHQNWVKPVHYHSCLLLSQEKVPELSPGRLGDSRGRGEGSGGVTKGGKRGFSKDSLRSQQTEIPDFCHTGLKRMP